jgi:hypothetical protein
MERQYVAGRAVRSRHRLPFPATTALEARGGPLNRPLGLMTSERSPRVFRPCPAPCEVKSISIRWVWFGELRGRIWSVWRPKGSLIWTTLTSVPKAVCEQLVRAVARHADQIAYVSTAGDAPVVPPAVESNWVCRAAFIDFTLITLDPLNELRGLSDDIQNAVGKVPKNSTDKLFMSGSSATFQVSESQEVSPGYFQNSGSRLRGAIANVTLAVCRPALLAGPQAFGTHSFESLDGKAVPSPKTRAASDALCYVGRSRSSRTLGAGCGGREGAIDERRQRGRRSRVVLVPRRWHQVCG